MKKYLIIFLIFAFALSMIFIGTSCKEKAPEETAEKLVIGRILIFAGDDFQQMAQKHFLNYCDEIGAEGIVLDSNFDAEEEKKNMEDLISRDVDAIIVQPVTAFTATALSDMVKTANIPIVTYITESGNFTLVTSDEITANTEAGKKTAELWKTLHPDTPIVACVLEDAAVGWTRINRSNPFIAGVKAADPEATIIEVELSDLGTEAIMASFEDTITANPEINLLSSTASFVSLACLEVLGAIGRGTPETEIIHGIQGSLEEYKKIMDPNSAYKICTGMKPKDLEVTSIKYAIKLINGEIGREEKITIGAPAQVLDSNSDWKQYLKDQWLTDIE